MVSGGGRWRAGVAFPQTEERARCGHAGAKSEAAGIGQGHRLRREVGSSEPPTSHWHARRGPRITHLRGFQRSKLLVTSTLDWSCPYLTHTSLYNMANLPSWLDPRHQDGGDLTVPPRPPGLSSPRYQQHRPEGEEKYLAIGIDFGTTQVAVCDPLRSTDPRANRRF